jgi:amino-acid N-acetyltransferase
MSPSSGSRIRPGQRADMPAILALLQSARLPTTDLASAVELRTWVMESSGSLHGVIALERFGTDGLLRSLAVEPGYRRVGVGRELVARLEHDAFASGVRKLVLLTETAESFFQSLGYERVDRGDVGDAVQGSAEFRSLCPASAACMAKTLVSPFATGPSPRP